MIAVSLIHICFWLPYPVAVPAPASGPLQCMMLLHAQMGSHSMETTKPSKFARFIRKGVVTTPTPHPEVSAPRLGLKSGGDFGHKEFSMSWWAITEPFVMVEDCHKHDFDQFIIFAGGDITDMTQIGGIVEFGLSEDGVNIETQVITEATMIFIPAGLYHGPLNFKKINDPKKPILFHDLFFSPEYKRV
jgi:hypothetical protein